MKRIAALALIAALGATAASAEEIKPVTSTQAVTTPIPVPNIYASFFTPITIGVITTVLTFTLVNDNSGT